MDLSGSLKAAESMLSSLVYVVGIATDRMSSGRNEVRHTGSSMANNVWCGRNQCFTWRSNYHTLNVCNVMLCYLFTMLGEGCSHRG